MAKKQYSGVRESKPGRINDLGTTGKEVEEQFRKGCLKKAGNLAFPKQKASKNEALVLPYVKIFSG